MSRNFLVMLIAGLLCITTATAGVSGAQRGDQKLDLVLKCTASDSSWSKIVNVTSLGMAVWRADNGGFGWGIPCSHEKIIERNGGRYGAYGSCETTPTGIRMELRGMSSGFSSPDRDYLMQGFLVDRTTGKFKYVDTEDSGQKTVFDVSGECVPTERPKPPVTKF